MKTIIYVPLIIIFLIGVLLLTGCEAQSKYGPPRPYTDHGAARLWDGNPNDLTILIYKDPKTLCEYLVARGVEGITPRMRADGTQVCE